MTEQSRQECEDVACGANISRGGITPQEVGLGLRIIFSTLAAKSGVYREMTRKKRFLEGSGAGERKIRG